MFRPYARTLTEAEFHLKEAIEHSRSVGAPRLLVTSYTYLARVQLARGDGSDALESIRSAVQLVQQHHLARRYAGPVAACQVRLWLTQGNVATAMAWADSAELTVDDELDYLLETEHLALARVLIARRDFNRALDFLQRLQQAAEAVGRVAGVIETMALQAVALHARGDTTRAGNVLERALALAEPEGYLRRFVDEGTPMAELLRILSCQPSAAGLRPCIDRVLAGFGTGVEVTPVMGNQKVRLNEEAFNERELTILRLIADGCSNRQIADKLVIAVSTVKTHINNCYGKLGVHSRTQGIARARELGLL